MPMRDYTVEWGESLKVGDEVAILRDRGLRWGIHKVVKVTPKQVHVSGYGSQPQRFWKKDGQMVGLASDTGRSSWCRDYVNIQPVTDEIRQDVDRKKCEHRFLHRIDWSKVTPEQVDQLMSIALPFKEQ